MSPTALFQNEGGGNKEGESKPCDLVVALQEVGSYTICDLVVALRFSEVRGS